LVRVPLLPTAGHLAPRPLSHWRRELACTRNWRRPAETILMLARLSPDASSYYVFLKS
jgi:hypothetical protein